MVQAVSQGVVELLALLGETRLYNTKETVAFRRQEWSLLIHIHTQDRGIDFGCWIKCFCRYAFNNTRLPIKLDTQCQDAQFPRFGDNALRNLHLHHHYQQTRWTGTL